MKFSLFISLIFCFCSSFASNYRYPNATISFPNNNPLSVYKGESLRILMQLNFSNFLGQKRWSIPAGTHLEYAGGTCPSIPYDEGAFWGNYICKMYLVVSGDKIGHVFNDALRYRVKGSDSRWPHKHTWDYVFKSPNVTIQVIPHPLSLANIPMQEAKANEYFLLNLKPSIKYLDENLEAKQVVKTIVQPQEQDGLRFDANSLSIVGKPEHIGSYVFRLSAQNAHGTTEETSLDINVSADSKDKPVFKTLLMIPSAVSTKKYSLNLLDLIEHNSSFMTSNQISFKIDQNQPYPDWLHIVPEQATLIEGIVPANLAGQETTITLIAHSNTGGDSEAQTIHIPIAYDPEKKPVINAFTLEQAAGKPIQQDLSGYIQDPAQDNDLKIIIDKVQPAAPWLSVSPLNPTVLEGVIPNNDTGKTYQISLHANTTTGGNSDSVTIPLQVSIDKELTPRLQAAQPLLPILHPGLSFNYDFVANQDITPAYESIPYEVSFAPGYQIPYWLRIDNNQLIAEQIPELNEESIDIYIVIKNLPGGSSKPILLSLYSSAAFTH